MVTARLPAIRNGTKGRESIPFFRPVAREIQAARPEAMSRTASIRERP